MPRRVYFYLVLLFEGYIVLRAAVRIRIHIILYLFNLFVCSHQDLYLAG